MLTHDGIFSNVSNPPQSYSVDSELSEFIQTNVLVFSVDWGHIHMHNLYYVKHLEYVLSLLKSQINM